MLIAQMIQAAVICGSAYLCSYLHGIVSVLSLQVQLCNNRQRQLCSVNVTKFNLQPSMKIPWSQSLPANAEMVPVKRKMVLLFSLLTKVNNTLYLQPHIPWLDEGLIDSALSSVLAKEAIHISTTGRGRPRDKLKKKMYCSIVFLYGTWESIP